LDQRQNQWEQSHEKNNDNSFAEQAEEQNSANNTKAMPWYQDDISVDADGATVFTPSVKIVLS